MGLTGGGESRGVVRVSKFVDLISSPATVPVNGYLGGGHGNLDTVVPRETSLEP